MTAAHRYDPQEDRCVCGGQIVYWDDDGTYGCDVGGPIFDAAGEPVDARLRSRLPAGWVDLDQDPTGGDPAALAALEADHPYPADGAR